MKGLSLVFICLLFWSTNDLDAQSRATNILEFQYGKIPGADTESFPSIYDRTTFSYRQSSFKAGITIEQYYSQYSERNYTNLAQGLLQYKKKKWDIKVGNFYETLGRGLLLRAFEIKGAVIEELGFRSRQYFHRDFLGAVVGYKTKKFSVQAMRADVLNSFDPTFGREDRRTDLVTSLAFSAHVLKKHKAGLHLMHHQDNSNSENTFGSFSLEGPISESFNYYIEYASGLNETDKYAAYGGITGLIGNMSFNFELKSYENFIIGSGINEPPALVQDQTYRLLNRTTHVSNPIEEDGYQIDISYSFENGDILVFNHSLARNKVGDNAPIFREYFLEWSHQLNQSVDFKLFADFSEDPFKFQDNRFSFGLYPSIVLSKKVRLQPEIEWQTFERFDTQVSNQSYLLGLNYASKFNLSLLYETTNDPFLVLDDQTIRHYAGVNISYKPNYKHSLRLFLGERQGGPACSSGVCFEILDFKGVECRWTSRF